jgi:probable HAF family extracellular repeat protein
LVTLPGSFQDVFDASQSDDGTAFGINDSGEIVGFQAGSTGPSLGGFLLSFGYEVDLNDLNALNSPTALPGAPDDALPTSVDNAGGILGILSQNYEIFQVFNGSYAPVPLPDPIVWTNVSPDGNSILIDDADGANLLLTSGGYVPFNVPADAEAQGLNDQDQVVGFYDAAGADEGFFTDTDGTVYGIDISGSIETRAQDINNNGEIVGYYEDSNSQMHGFTTTVAAVEAVDDILAVACYCAGTLIATENGDVPVETLKIGDTLLTGSGMLRPIKWIGRRSYGGRFITGNTNILPICIKAGALDDNVPLRDLWISPHHAMFVDGLLIEARDLVNGTSIVQAERVDKVSYFHIELETHDVIVAEGALSETFLDDDSRGMFQNAPEFHALYPDAAGLPAQYCARRVEDGYELEAVRQRIALRAATAVEPRIRIFRRHAKAG